MRAATLISTSSQSEVCTQSYGAPKLRETQLWQFWDSQVGVPGQNAIWMWASWRGTKYNRRGKVVASPKSGSWWVLWVWICSWFVLTPKVFQLCTKKLVVWFCARPCEWLSACHSSWSHLGAPTCPSTRPKCCKQGSVLRLLILPLFHFRLTFESIEELGARQWPWLSQINHVKCIRFSQIDHYDLTLNQMNHIHLMI
jgi:hypothetical protein